MDLSVLLSVTDSVGVTQLVVLRLVFCWSRKPVEGEGKEMITFTLLNVT